MSAVFRIRTQHDCLVRWMQICIQPFSTTGTYCGYTSQRPQPSHIASRQAKHCIAVAPYNTARAPYSRATAPYVAEPHFTAPDQAICNTSSAPYNTAPPAQAHYSTPTAPAHSTARAPAPTQCSRTVPVPSRPADILQQAAAAAKTEVAAPGGSSSGGWHAGGAARGVKRKYDTHHTHAGTQALTQALAGTNDGTQAHTGTQTLTATDQQRQRPQQRKQIPSGIPAHQRTTGASNSIDTGGGSIGASQPAQPTTPPTPVGKAVNTRCSRTVCPHGRRQRSRCKDCGGASICEHGRRRTQCR